MTTIRAHATNYTIGRTKPIDRIVVHYTAGNNDTAENNGNYFSKPNREASAHYFVDENSVVQSVQDKDTAYHAGNWEMNCRSIGVEMCTKKDGNGVYSIDPKTINNAQYLIKQLMAKYDIPIPGVIRHYDVNGKHCPAPLLEQDAWDKFRAGLVENVKVEQSAEWAQASWQKAANKGVLDGTRPLDAITRQEIAAIIDRLGLLD